MQEDSINKLELAKGRVNPNIVNCDPIYQAKDWQIRKAWKEMDLPNFNVREILNSLVSLDDDEKLQLKVQRGRQPIFAIYLQI